MTVPTHPSPEKQWTCVRNFQNIIGDRTTRKTFHPRLTKGVKNKPGNNLLMGPIITNKQTTNKAGVKRTGRKER